MSSEDKKTIRIGPMSLNIPARIDTATSPDEEAVLTDIPQPVIEEFSKEDISQKEEVSEPVPPATQLKEVKKIDVVPDEDEGVLRIYSENCLNCKHLFSEAKKIFNKCHFSANRSNKHKGNKYCPASSLKIEILLPIEDAAKSIVAHTRANNMQRVSELYRKLEKYSESQREKCIRRVSQLLSESSKKK